MDLNFNQQLASAYKSPSQIVRVLSEDWVAKQSYCPNCSAQPLAEFANNEPVADFYCANCKEQFELKSKKAKLSQIINDGAKPAKGQRHRPRSVVTSSESWVHGMACNAQACQIMLSVPTAGS